MRYKMWENSSLRKPHFSAISGTVILMRGLIAGYVILCGTGRHWRYSSVNIPTFQLVQGSEGLSRDLIHLQRDDRRTKELSRSILKYNIYRLNTLSSQGWGHLLGRQIDSLLGGSPYTLPYLWRAGM